jgi:hypothetical protein
MAGQPVLAVQAQPAAAENGVAPARHVLYVAPGTLRPVVRELRGGDGYEEKLTFSHRHEQVSLTAPAHAVPAAQLPSSFPKA